MLVDLLRPTWNSTRAGTIWRTEHVPIRGGKPQQAGRQDTIYRNDRSRWLPWR
jgi:hypothetical protein